MRNMMLAAIAVFLTLGTLAVPTYAEQKPDMLRTDELREHCRDAIAFDENKTEELAGTTGLCVGYLNGYWDAMTLMLAVADVKAVCVPGEVTMGQQARIYVKYTDEHPELLQRPAYETVFKAIKNAFPCPKSDKNGSSRRGEFLNEKARPSAASLKFQADSTRGIRDSE